MNDPDPWLVPPDPGRVNPPDENPDVRDAWDDQADKSGRA